MKCEASKKTKGRQAFCRLSQLPLVLSVGEQAMIENSAEHRRTESTMNAAAWVDRLLAPGGVGQWAT